MNYNKILEKLTDGIYVINDQIETHEKLGLQNTPAILLLRGEMLALKEFKDWFETEFKEALKDNTKA